MLAHHPFLSEKIWVRHSVNSLLRIHTNVSIRTSDCKFTLPGRKSIGRKYWYFSRIILVHQWLIWSISISAYIISDQSGSKPIFEELTWFSKKSKQFNQSNNPSDIAAHVQCKRALAFTGYCVHLSVRWVPWAAHRCRDDGRWLYCRTCGSACSIPSHRGLSSLWETHT